MKFPKPTRSKDKAYIEWIRSLNCCITGSRGPSDPHHIPKLGESGMGTKTDDRRAIPLRHDVHVEYHNLGRLSFAAKYNLDYEYVIKKLNAIYESSKN